MQFNRRFSAATCNYLKHREQRHLAANYFGVLSELYIKQIKTIMKY